MNKKQSTIESLTHEEFKKIMVSIKQDIKTTQIRTFQNVNNEMINLYYRIGKTLYENSKYGNSFIKKISESLKIEYPNLKGYSPRNLNYMKLFYQEYKDDLNLQQLVANLPWGHNIILFEKIKDKKVRTIYAKATLENGWSRNILEMQIETNYHKRVGNSINNFSTSMPPQDSDLANKTLKDPYIFDFICLNNNYKEKELEIKMIEKIKNVLLEFGTGFSFVANQYKISIGNEDYFLDLLFYHIKLRCYIIVELKTTKFKPEYIGKMNFYLSVYIFPLTNLYFDF